MRRIFRGKMNTDFDDEESGDSDEMMDLENKIKYVKAFPSEAVTTYTWVLTAPRNIILAVCERFNLNGKNLQRVQTLQKIS